MEQYPIRPKSLNDELNESQIDIGKLKFGSAEAAYATICIAADDAIARADKVI